MDQEAKHTVSRYFALAQLENAERQGLCRQTLLKKSGLSESQLAKQSRLAPQNLAALFHHIWKQLDDETMGLCARPIKLGVFALAAERMVLCSTLGEALAQNFRFYHMIDPGFSIKQKRIGSSLHISISLDKPELDPQYLLIELLLLVWHRFPGWLVGKPIPLQEIHFAFAPPKHRDEYALLYPAPCRFFQPHNTMIWPAEVLDWPIQRNVEQLQQYLSRVPLPWFRKQQFHESISDQVCRLLENSIDDEQLSTVEEIASQLHMTSRTLRRKLTAEGNSFAQLKEELRRQRALHWLNQADIPISEVARRCGYTEPTAFMRAFKNWTKKTPGQYRRRR